MPEDPESGLYFSQVLYHFREALRQGKDPDVEAWCAQYPFHAEGLRPVLTELKATWPAEKTCAPDPVH